MGVAPFSLLRILIQVAIAAVSAAVIGLIIKGFTILNHDDNEVKNLLPDGKLHAVPIIGSSIALLVTSALALGVSLLSMLLLAIGRFASIFKKLAGVMLGGVLFVLTPVQLAETVIAARRSAYVTAPGFPDELIESLLSLSGRSLRYKDIDVVVAYTVLGWVLWALLLLGTLLAFHSSSRERKIQTTTSVPQHQHQHPQEPVMTTVAS